MHRLIFDQYPFVSDVLNDLNFTCPSLATSSDFDSGINALAVGYLTVLQLRSRGQQVSWSCVCFDVGAVPASKSRVKRHEVQDDLSCQTGEPQGRQKAESFLKPA